MDKEKKKKYFKTCMEMDDDVTGYIQGIRAQIEDQQDELYDVVMDIEDIKDDWKKRYDDQSNMLHLAMVRAGAIRKPFQF